jgi:hypothetical protein
LDPMNPEPPITTIFMRVVPGFCASSYSSHKSDDHLRW